MSCEEEDHSKCFTCMDYEACYLLIPIKVLDSKRKDGDRFCTSNNDIQTDYCVTWVESTIMLSGEY